MYSPWDPGGRGHRHGPQSWLDSLAQLKENFGGQLLAIALVVLAVGAVAFAVRHRPDLVIRIRGRSVALNPAAGSLALGAGAAIALGTLTRQTGDSARGQVQLVPLHTLRGYAGSTADLLIYLGGNVALFVPLGFFLYLAVRRWVLGCTLFCGLVSLGVEVLQIPIWSRSTDVDDVLTNTAGGLLGVLAGWLALRLLRTYRGSRPEPSPTWSRKMTPARQLGRAK